MKVFKGLTWWDIRDCCVYISRRLEGQNADVRLFGISNVGHRYGPFSTQLWVKIGRHFMLGYYLLYELEHHLRPVVHKSGAPGRPGNRILYCGPKYFQHNCCVFPPLHTKMCRLQLKCDGTRWRTGGKVKGKLANGVGSHYPSHYLRTWCIQHFYRWCAHLGCQ